MNIFQHIPILNLFLVITSVVLLFKREIQNKILWLCLIILVPVIGSIVFMFNVFKSHPGALNGSKYQEKKGAEGQKGGVHER